MTGGLILDIAVITILLFSVVIAVLRGFIREVLTVLGLIGGAAAAYVLGPLLKTTTRGWLGVSDSPEEQQEQFMDMVPYSLIADVLAYGMVFVVFLIVLSIISYFLSKFVQSIGLGAVDRALGAVFGIVRAALVIGLLYLPFYYTLDDESKNEWFGNTEESTAYVSKTQVYVEGISAFLAEEVIPQSAKQAVGDKLEEAGKSEARKKMEELDILRGEKDPAQQADQSTPKRGYTEEFREGMDELIKKVEENVEVKPAESSLNE